MTLESLIDLLKKTIEPKKTLMDRAWELITQEEQSIVSANRIAEKIAETISIEVPTLPRPVPITFRPQSLTVSKHHTFFEDIYGIGALIDFVLVSASSNYRIKVTRDEETLFDNSWTEIEAISQASTNISAYIDPDTNYYYLTLHNINFNNKIRLLLSTTTSITFSSVYYNLLLLRKE